MLFETLLTTVIVVLSSSRHNLAESSNCPSQEQISPCSCYKDNGKIVGLCANFEDEADIQQIFDRIEGWNFHELVIRNCVMNYIPASILEHITINTLTINSSNLVSLFNEPLKPYTMNVQINNVTLSRGMQWELLKAIDMKNFIISDGNIKKIDNSFRLGVPESIVSLEFQNTKTTGIVDGALASLKELASLAITHNHLSSVKRSMFPTPSKLITLNLSYNEISSLPHDIIKDMKTLGFFDISHNRIKTVSQDFIPYGYYGILLNVIKILNVDENPISCGCDMKWIPTEISSNWPPIITGTCARPKNLEGKQLKDLTQKDFDYC